MPIFANKHPDCFIFRPVACACGGGGLYFLTRSSPLAGASACCVLETEVLECGVQVISKKPGHKDPYHGRRFRWWFFTWNNPSHPSDKENLLKEGGFVYIKFQLEKGKEGTEHYQGVFYCKSASTCSALTKKYPRCGYLAPAKSVKGSVAYCGKAESRIDGPWEAGTLPSAGKRTDLLECKSIIDGGGKLKDIFQTESTFGSAVRYYKGLEKYIALVNKKERSWLTNCFVYYGLAGMGKTESVIAETKRWEEITGCSTYWLTLESGIGKVWWGDDAKHYDGEENVVIDEFHCQMRLEDFKRMIDKSPYMVPYKGGYTPFLAKRVWVISNYPINNWYHHAAPLGSEARKAFTRRLHYVEEFSSRWCSFSDLLDLRSLFVDSIVDGTFVINTNRTE